MAIAIPDIRLPGDEELELHRRFTVNRNYLQAISGFVRTKYGRGEKLYEGLLAAVSATQQYKKIQRGQPDLEEVRRWLTLAWTSEIQLHLPAIMGSGGMLAFANTWAPVHAYYAVFGTLQAWFAANGMISVAGDHTATLRTISSQIKQRDLFPEPWNLLAVGCPMRKERTHLNDRGVDCTSSIEVLSYPHPFGVDPEFWPRYGAWLRSTRRARLEAREEQWKRSKGKKHRPGRANQDCRKRCADLDVRLLLANADQEQLRDD